MRECQRLENIHLRYNYKLYTDITRKKKSKNFDETNNSYKKYIRKKGKILVEHNKKYRPTQLDEEPS